MLGSFLPPVVFEVTANATQALASFKQVNTQLSLMEAQALKTGKALTGFQKAAIVGSKAIKVMTGSFLVAAGIGVKMAMDLEKSLNRLGTTLTALGLSTAENRKQISLLVDSYEELGFGSEDAADAYGRLITMTKNVETSNRLLAMSADLARARTMSLESAASLLARAQMGNTRVFRQFGITLDATKPKALAIEEAMGKLEARLSGQALAYTKTFAGQLAVMNESLGDIFETIGMKLLPMLNKLLEKLKGTGKFMKDYAKEIEAAATAITVLLIPAVVNLTKKLAALALTLLKSPIVRIIALVYGLAYAFNRASGQANSFAKIFGGVADKVLAMISMVVNGVENLVQTMMYFAKAGLMARKAFQDLKGDREGAAATQKELDAWEKEYRAIDNWSGNIEKARQKIRDFQKDYKGLQLETIIPQIPGFGDGTFVDDTTGGVNALGEALINAKQRIQDFNAELKSTFVDLKGAWASIAGRDFNAAIQEGLLNPIDKLVTKTNTAVTAYQEASKNYQTALNSLTAAQNKYTSAVQGGNKAIIASTESALKRAETLVTDLQTSMGDALADIAQLQQEMIDAVIESENKITELRAERTKVLQDGMRAELELQKDYNQKVAQLQKDAADRSAEIVKQSVDQIRNAFKSATYKGIGNIFSDLTFEGKYLAGGSIDAITKALAKQAEKATSLADKAGKLQALGFTQTFIEEVISQGPDVGGALADIILAGNSESIKQLQSYWLALEKVSSHGVDNLAKTLNSGMTLATEELTASLANVQTELTSALSEAYNEYSDSLTEIRAKTAEQIKVIDDQITQLIAKIAQLKAALESLATLNAPGTAPTQTSSGVPIGSTLSYQLSTVNSKLLESIVSGASAVQVGEQTRLDMLKQGASVSGAASSARYTAQAIAYFQSELAKEKAAGTTSITINANTNASSQLIANDVGWAIRTSSDVQYNAPRGARRIE
jgi:hypothetical protein